MAGENTAKDAKTVDPSMLDRLREGCDPLALLQAGDHWVQRSSRSVDEPEMQESGFADLAKLSRAAVDWPEAPQFSLWKLAGNAHRLAGSKFWSEAESDFEKAFRLATDRDAIHFDYALLCKWRRDWAKMAASLDLVGHPARDRGWKWNRAIAASALGDAGTARSMWKQMGFPVDAENERLPVVDKMPSAFFLRVPVKPRIGAGRFEFEVVSVAPISPCHGVVQGPVFGEGPCEYGDVVMWDGAPVGQKDGKLPIFALLDILHRGNEHSVQWFCESASADALQNALTSFEHIYSSVDGRRGVIIADDEKKLRSIADAISSLRSKEGGRFSFLGLYEALGETEAAGKEHQRWGRLDS